MGDIHNFSIDIMFTDSYGIAIKPPLMDKGSPYKNIFNITLFFNFVVIPELKR